MNCRNIAIIIAALFFAVSCNTDTTAPVDNFPDSTSLPDNFGGEDDDDDDNDNDDNNNDNACESDEDCLEGWGCKDNLCRAVCDDRIGCKKGFHCSEDGFCMPGCASDLDCEETEVCKDGACKLMTDAGDDDDDNGQPDDDDDNDDCECDIPGAEHRCHDGECFFVKCKDGFHNLNGTLDDGCEYECIVSNGGEEICDGLDNDCDGKVDNMPDFLTNPNHCGNCQTQCKDPPNASAFCQAGKCLFICNEGYFDNDGNPDNGCEDEQCVPSNNGVEICDGRDNNCNGKVDEGFRKDLDTSCGHRCADCTKIAPHMKYACIDGVCEYLGCEDGWYNLDGNPETGCEYRCTPTADKKELCNGRDDDCNPATPDGVDDPLVGTSCIPDNAFPGCDKGAFICNIFGQLECKALGGSPEVCNGIDDDCDGIVDNNAPCPAGQRCLGGQCVTSDCEDECTPEGSYCQNTTTKIVCEDSDPSDPCLEKTVVACPSGTTCYQGDCQEICLPYCEGLDCGPDGCGGTCGECGFPPPAVCVDENTLRSYSGTGECKSGLCYFESADSSCAHGCKDGVCQACVPDCEGKQCGDDGCGETCGGCITPPDNYCVDANISRRYEQEGSCENYQCKYTYTDVNCANGCASGGVCNACTPDCTGKQCGDDGCGGSCGTCNSAPATTCTDANTLKTYSSPGTCSSAGACSYSSTTTNCPYGCENGACKTCTPKCDGKVCGDNGCGGVCGTCPSGQFCGEGQCRSSGCSDGTVEGVSSNGMMFACRGGFGGGDNASDRSKYYGLHRDAPACDRKAGNTGERPGGYHCTIQDLCAPGYHVCRNKEEVAQHGGCNLLNLQDGFWATRQRARSTDYMRCANPNENTQDNNFFGCGNSGRTEVKNCDPITRVNDNACGGGMGNQSWYCENDAGREYTKVSHGTGVGGVLCCKD